MTFEDIYFQITAISEVRDFIAAVTFHGVSDLGENGNVIVTGIKESYRSSETLLSPSQMDNAECSVYVHNSGKYLLYNCAPYGTVHILRNQQGRGVIKRLRSDCSGGLLVDYGN